MKIHGTENLSNEEISAQLQQGARFLMFPYCVSVLVMSFKRSSGVHFVPAGESAAGKRLQFALLSLVFGWWGIPWGPIWTLGTVYRNIAGGIDVTREVLGAAQAADVPRAPTAA